MPEVVYAGMARDLDGNEIGGYWQEEPQGEPKYILADTSIGKDEHNEKVQGLINDRNEAWVKIEELEAKHLEAMNGLMIKFDDYLMNSIGLNDEQRSQAATTIEEKE